MESVKEKVKEAGVKKTWLAEKVGISNVLLSHYLNGTRQMPDHIKREILRICDAILKSV